MVDLPPVKLSPRGFETEQTSAEHETLTRKTKHPDIVSVFPSILSALALIAVGSGGVGAQDQPAAAEPLFRVDRINALVAILIFGTAVMLYTRWARRGKPLFVRKLAGLDAIEEAVGRATEMGKPVLFIPGLQELDEIETIAGVSILGRVARITAQYETPLIVPVRYPLVLAAGQEVVEQAYRETGHADAYNKDTVRYVAGDQMAFAATVNGILMREKPAANIYMGAFFAESLVIAETGNAAGSIQIAGTAKPEQLPFFIAACDYTLMGEELYAASAYLSHEPMLLGGLKGQDLFKILLVLTVIIGMVLMLLGAADTYLSWFTIK